MPAFALSNRWTVGGYYLLGRAIDPADIKTNQYLAGRMTVSHVPVGAGLEVQFAPQFYYLHLDSQTGEYVSGTATVSRGAYPVSITAFFNTPLHTNVVGGHDTLWSVSVNYRMP